MRRLPKPSIRGPATSPAPCRAVSAAIMDAYACSDYGCVRARSGWAVPARPPSPCFGGDVAVAVMMVCGFGGASHMHIGI